MGNIRLVASSLFALTTLVACGDDGGATTIIDSGIVDAPPVDNAPPIDQPPPVTYDLACATNTTPPAAATTITVSGIVSDVSTNGLTPLAGATAKACKGDCMDANLIATATPDPTTNTGAFSTGAMASNGNPIDGYLSITAAGHLPTRIYPFAALTTDLSDVPAPMLTPAVLQVLAFGGFTQDAGKGIVAAAVTDCSATLTGVTGATVEVLNGTTPVGDDALDVAALLQDDSYAGIYFILNVPPGDYTVKVTYNSTQFLDNTISVVADGLTGAQMRPGY